MATAAGRSSLGPSLPPPSPKSPPKYPDLHGKRREIARVQMLEKEISVLQDELKFTEGLQPASTYCKELIDFVVANADPLLPTNKKKHRLYRRFWKWLCRMPSLNLYWICCYCCDGCNLRLKLPQRCCKCCKLCDCTCCLPSSCSICVLPKWRCFSCPKSNCCKHSCRCQNCCIIPRCCKFDCPSSPSCCTCKCSCSCSCPSCPVVNPCCCFMSRSCWKNCYCTCTCPRMTVC
ncbi:guanine nucleotide-binding protein subunit gamma 3-like [Neltuma alba]|uniref:guanine nucleotide-binding protein subunit gamma 3-like n=1 Tax=Neltuma alba TaxID=207710 RepID=UPI0010A513E1|nr:guanine nucleotide-binding protein subunit gamma 3-like [Prosopis alba]XP_028796651.1 guanine nucleotide-binding protein subunit gamma 3-like [Prosopis alba]